MSYIKNVRISDVEIESLNGKVASIGDGIQGIIQFDYFESIFKPSISAALMLACDVKLSSELPIVGTEKVRLKIEHDSGKVEFKDWVVGGISEPLSSSTQSVLSLALTTEENIKQEYKSKRLTQRFDPKVPISSHIQNILLSLGIDSSKITIEDTANSYGFFGNYWRPFKAIYWLARRSMAKGGGDRAGFLFWQTRSGYKFKSIDTIAANAKNNVVQSFEQREYVDEGGDADNFKILSPFMEYNQNIIQKLRTGGYGDMTRFFNPYTLPQTILPTDEHKYEDTVERTDSLGTTKFKGLRLGVGEEATNVDVLPYVSGTMTQDGTVDPGTDDGNPQKWVSQSNIKYQQLMSQSLRLTVPMNLQLEAGDPVNLSLVASNKGVDKHESGIYLVKDLRHTIKFEDDGVKCFTNLRCIRDTYGSKGLKKSIPLLNS